MPSHRFISIASISVLLMLVGTAWGQPQPSPDLTLERIFASPELSGSSLRQVKLSPAGDRVTFIQGRSDDRSLMDLWEYHISDQAMRRLIESIGNCLYQDRGCASLIRVP